MLAGSISHTGTKTSTSCILKVLFVARFYVTKVVFESSKIQIHGMTRICLLKQRSCNLKQFMKLYMWMLPIIKAVRTVICISKSM